jgi:WD40 repeat protein
MSQPMKPTASDEHLFHLMVELMSIRIDPESFIRDFFQELRIKLNQQRDLFINEMLLAFSSYYQSKIDQLNESEAVCIDKLKLDMRNRFDARIRALTYQMRKKPSPPNLQKLSSDGTEIKNSIQSIITLELARLDAPFKYESSLVQVDLKFKSSQLLSVKLHKIPDLNCLSLRASLDKHFGDVYKLYYIPSKNQVLSASVDNSIKLWNLQTNECIWTILMNQPTFDVSENALICAENKGSLKIFNIETGALLQSFNDVDFQISVILVLSSDLILTGLLDGEILIWSKECSKIHNILPGHLNQITALKTLKPTEVLSGSKDMIVKLWDLEENKLVRVFNGHKNWVTCLEVFNENEFLSGSKDGTIKIWHRKLESCVETLVHSSGVYTMKLFENYQLFSCGEDGTVKHWDTVNAVCLKCLKVSHTSAVFDFIVLESNALVTSEAKKIKIWE